MSTERGRGDGIPARAARSALLLGLALVVAFYGEVLTYAPATGQDFRNFYAAATLLRHGGNPYDQRQLLLMEEQLYHPTTAAQRAALAGNPYVQGPPLAIALMPATGLRPAAVYTWYAVLLAVVAAAALALLARLWSVPRPLPRLVLLLISPVTFLGVLLGQPDAFLLLLVAVALALYRRHPIPAGFLLALGLVKPQIMAGPIILFAILAWRRGDLARYAAGLLAGAAVFLGGSALLAGPAVVGGWLRELAGFGGATVYTQVDISSLSTLYVGWAPHALGLVLAVAAPIGWMVLCLRTGQAVEREHDERWWLALGLTGWLLVTPYAHPHDDVLLLPAAWYLLDRLLTHGMVSGRVTVGKVVVGGMAILLAISWWLLPMTSVLGLRPPLIRGLGIIPVLLLYALLALRRPAPDGGLRAPATTSPDRAICAHRIAS